MKLPETTLSDAKPNEAFENKKRSLTLNVIKVELQHDDFQPIPPDPLSFENIHPKRAIATMVVRDGLKESPVTAILEFRGDALTLTRPKEELVGCETVAHWLQDYYKKRYDREGLRIVGVHDEGRVVDCTVTDPEHFFRFLHLIKTRPLEVVTEIPESIPVSKDKFEFSGSFRINPLSLQLTEQVYIPLLNEATSWSDPNTANFRAWTELQKTAPHLLRLVRTEISSIFDDADQVFRRIHALTLSLSGLLTKASFHARESLGLTVSHPGPGFVFFRILIGDAVLETIYLQRLWLSGKTLHQFAKDLVAERYPGIEWTLDLQIDGYTELVDFNKVLQFAGSAQSFLRQEPDALEIQKKYEELRELGRRARIRINGEFSEMVRPDYRP